MLDELQLQLARRIPRLLHAPLSDEIVWIVEDHYPAEPRNHLLQKLEALRREIRNPAVDARESASRLPEALDEARSDGIGTDIEHNGDSLRNPFDCECDRGGDRIDQVDLLPFEIRGWLLDPLEV